MGNKTPSDTYRRVELACIKVQGHSSSEPTGIQSRPDTFDESRFIMTFLTILGVTEICSFRLVLEEKTGKEIPKSSRLEVLENFLANNMGDLGDSIKMRTQMLKFQLHQRSLGPIYVE